MRACCRAGTNINTELDHFHRERKRITRGSLGKPIMNEQNEHDVLHEKGANCAHEVARGRAFPHINYTIFQFASSVFNTRSKQHALHVFDKSITIAQALLYAAGGFILCKQPSLLAAYIVIPALSFFVGTALRSLINAPRPAETLDVTPLISGDAATDTTTDATRANVKRGKSFPGKHAFSAWSIAGISVCMALFTNAQYADVMLVFALVESVIALVICAVRVLGIVHMIQDVIAGFVLALIVEAILCALWLTLF